MRKVCLTLPTPQVQGAGVQWLIEVLVVVVEGVRGVVWRQQQLSMLHTRCTVLHCSVVGRDHRDHGTGVERLRQQDAKEDEDDDVDDRNVLVEVACSNDVHEVVVVGNDVLDGDDRHGDDGVSGDMAEVPQRQCHSLCSFHEEEEEAEWIHQTLSVHAVMVGYLQDVVVNNNLLLDNKHVYVIVYWLLQGIYDDQQQ